MIIKIPNNNISERTYIIDVLIGEFLGLSYSIQVSDINNYIISFDKKKIEIEDHFFNKYTEDMSYLKMESIPNNVYLAENKFTTEKDVLVLFGNEKLVIESNKILCGNDIFAASFYMLTRWEEYVNPARDIHKRFSSKDSLAFKFSFLDRPIVNEYVEMLWNMLLHLGFAQNRKLHEYAFVLTHDVDIIRYHKNIRQLIKRIGGDLLKRKSPVLAKENIRDYIKVKSGNKIDPFDTFSWIMDLSEKVGVKSRFYFMSGGLTEFDNHYRIDDSASIKIIKEIKDRGHIIGFHPSYNTYNDAIQFKKEKERLENIVNASVIEGRQHYLRFETPKTWRIWNDNQMKRDLSLSYADKEGFRCGVCYEYSVFDIIQRRKMKLKELPLIVMEGSFITYQNISPDEMKEKIQKLNIKVKKYKGSFVFLWHNSSFNTPAIFDYQHIYEEIILNNI